MVVPVGAGNPLVVRKEIDMGYECESDEEDTTSTDLPSRITVPPPTLPIVDPVAFRADSERQYKNFKAACRYLNWPSLCPDLIDPEATGPVCFQLWKADMAPVYRKLDALNAVPLRDEDCGGPPHGYFLELALYSRYAIHAPAASSFCERVNSHGKLVMNCRSTQMKPAKVEERVMLRMNRHFMEHMRLWHPELTSTHMHLLLVANAALMEEDPE